MTAPTPGQVLIEPEQLAELLGRDTPVLADVRWNLAGPAARPEFEAAHIPGAQWVNLEAELSGPPGVGGRHPLPAAADFQAAMRRIGVAVGRRVVVYDGATSQSAARLWWLLTDAGLTGVQVLNGGFAAWRAVGLPVQSGPGEPVVAGDFVARPGARAVATVEELVGDLGPASDLCLVDVRAPERFRGEIEPIDPVAGHIPGALNRPVAGMLDENGRFLPPAQVREQLAGLAAEPVLYCGSGVTAAQALLALESAGLGGRIYPGSWSAWITDPKRPVATGDA